MISDLGPHGSYIIASYAVCVVLIGGLGLWIWREHAALTRRLAKADPRQGTPQTAMTKPVIAPDTAP